MHQETAPQSGVKVPPRGRGLHDLYARRQFEAVLHRECSRADRSACEFSLVLFRVRSGEQRATCRLAREVMNRARTVDEVGWFDDECIATLLFATGAEGAHAFAQDVLRIAQERLIPAASRFYTYPSAWYVDGETHRHGGGNGHNNGNGNGHSHGSSNGNGNGNGRRHHDGERISAPDSGESLPSGARQPERKQTRDLLPFVLAGMTDELRMPGTTDRGVEMLLIRRLPLWKRAIDVLGAAIGLVALSPVMAIAALAVKASSPGPVLFRQRRAGLGGSPFWIYKFRTMSADAEDLKAQLRPISEQDGPAFKIRHDPRVTRVGKFLRETSLDELPQLWNVLKGEMSLVGPRPLPMDESAACEQWQRRRLDVTPGLTCIWQVKGRSRVSFSDWMRMDVNYIRRRTFFHDVKILAQTIPAVLLRKGAK